MQVWVNTDDLTNVGKIAQALESAMKKYQAKEFKAFVIFMNLEKKDASTLSQTLTNLAEKYGLSQVALTYLSPQDSRSIQAYRVNASPEVKNTIFVYVNKKVTAKFVNLVADEKGLASLESAIGEVAK
ncbi:MAG: hypothetical protein K6T17_09075 [Fimbriimonadales bacterium]|nr:hypothetical protein [Fimbriimonadales bacterium]